jgi:hypothetical protein
MPQGLIETPPAASELPSAGDYLRSDRSLYRVERVLGGRALIEDCKTEQLIDVAIDDLIALTPVRPASRVD